MIPISEELRNLFMSGQRQVMRITTPGGGGADTVVYAVVDGTDTYPLSQLQLDGSEIYGTPNTRWHTWGSRNFFATGGFTLTEADIVQGGLTIDSYSMSTNRVEIGAAVASELTLHLTNPSGAFDDVYFEGVELHVELGVKDWSTDDEIQWMSLGFFVVDDEPESLQSIELTALDRMTFFDVRVDWDKFTFPVTLKDLVERSCEICDVPLLTNMASLPNAGYIISKAPAVDCDYRNIIQWAAFLTATCAMIDENGNLVFRWYEQTNIQLTTSNRYSHRLARDDVNVTGLRYTNDDGSEYLCGTDDYTVDFAGCAILVNTPEVALLNVWNAIKDFTYRPFEAVIKSAPFLQPLDMIEYVEADGTTHDCIVSAITFTGNQSTPLSGKGESNASAARAKQSAFTREQSARVDDASKHATDYLASDDHGLMIVDMSDGTVYTPSSVPEGVKNTYIDSDSFDVRDGTKTLASFGETSTIGNTEDGLTVEIKPGEFNIFDGDTVAIAKFRSRNIYDGRAFVTVSITNTDGVQTVFYSTYVISEIVGCSVISTGEPYEIPTKVEGSDYAFKFQTAPTEPVRVQLYTYETIYDICIGTRTSNYSNRSISVGYNNSPYGAEAVLIGANNESYTNYALGFGHNLEIDMTGPRGVELAQTVVGRYNVQKSGDDAAFIIGTGNRFARKNAVEITPDDDILIHLDTNAAGTTTDGELVAALTALGWLNDVTE